MKNLNCFKGDCFTFHKEVLEKKYTSKLDPDYKERLIRLNDLIESRFNLYKEKFDKNLLEDIEPISLHTDSKNDLFKLYSFNSSLFTKLFKVLTTNDQNREEKNCQLCTIGEVSTFDHYLPKSDFAEYVVNPLNLTPSCSKCNEKKSVNWKTNSKRNYLNLYLDLLPDEQYLFVEIDSELNLNYKIVNSGSIQHDLFEIISSHYNKLELLKRFSENSYSIISELETEIKNYFKFLSLDTIKNIIKDSCGDIQKQRGFNYWKVVLKLELIESESFMNRFIRQHTKGIRT